MCNTTVAQVDELPAPAVEGVEDVGVERGNAQVEPVIAGMIKDAVETDPASPPAIISFEIGVFPVIFNFLMRLPAEILVLQLVIGNAHLTSSLILAGDRPLFQLTTAG